MAGSVPLVLGALAPLSQPGIVAAGQELVAGMELAASRLNAAGGGAGGRIELRVVDTKGIPAFGVEAAGWLKREGAHALVGEYHSVVAVAVARESQQLKIPFVCASATLDAIRAAAGSPPSSSSRRPRRRPLSQNSRRSADANPPEGCH